MSNITRNRARLDILNLIIVFGTSRYYHSSDSIYGASDQKFCFISNSFNYNDIKKGDLVKITSAPFSKYYLSWVRDLKLENNIPVFLLESIEDQELCWWSNIGIEYFNRDTVKNNPQWLWDDNQYSFNDKWERTCIKKCGSYSIVPMTPIFDDKGGVTLTFRKKWCDYDEVKNPKKYFPKYKKVLVRDIINFHNEAKDIMETNELTKLT